jgi:repressor LexA
MLTANQARLLAFLKEAQAASPVGPSWGEMAAFMGLKSKSGVTRLIDALERRGAVRRRCHGAVRSIEIIGAPDYARGYRDGLAAGRAAVLHELGTSQWPRP